MAEAKEKTEEKGSEIQSMLATDKKTAPQDYKNLKATVESETVIYDIYSGKSFFMRVRDDAFDKWHERVKNMLAKTQKFTKLDILNYKKSRIYGVVRADPKLKVNVMGDDLLKFAKEMFKYVFGEGTELPKWIKVTKESKRYTFWITYKFRVRAEDEGHEKFENRIEKKFEKKPYDPETVEKMRCYVQKRMKLLGESVDRGEYDGYYGVLYRAIFPEDRFPTKKPKG